MKLKLSGKDEFEAFVLIVRLIRTKANGFDTLPDFLQLKSIEKLGMKLLNMQMALRHLKKTVTVPMDEAQAATVYYELTDNALKLGAYERNIACKIITQMELQYHNEKALKMSVMKPINLLIK